MEMSSGTWIANSGNGRPVFPSVRREFQRIRRPNQAVLWIGKADLKNRRIRAGMRSPSLTAILCSQDQAAGTSGITESAIRELDIEKQIAVRCLMLEFPMCSAVV